LDIKVHIYINAETQFASLSFFDSEVKIAFIIARKRDNVVVLFGTLKVQSFMLTEVRDCDLLIVVTSSTFLKRKEMLKEKKQLVQIIKTCSTAYI